MKRAHALIPGALLLALVVLGCGGNCRVLLSDGQVIGCAEVPPGPDDLAFGSAAEVLVEDASTGQRLWIGISGADGGTTFCAFQALRDSGRLSWIGGKVVVATDRSPPFFFDPQTILAAEITAEALQTTIAQIAQDPEFFTPEGAGGLDHWVVPAQVIAVEMPSSEPLQCPTPAAG